MISLTIKDDKGNLVCKDELYSEEELLSPVYFSESQLSVIRAFLVSGVTKLEIRRAGSLFIFVKEARCLKN